MPLHPLLDWIALALWLLLWLGYQWFALEPRFGRQSITSTMIPIRRRWMVEALHRENRISDASLIGNLMNSATFFSSTTLLILGGLFAFISSLDKNAAFVSNLPFAASTSLQSLEFKFLVLAFVFIYALFRFLWSIRQFNLLTILLGAYPAAPARTATTGAVPSAGAVPSVGPVPSAGHVPSPGAVPSADPVVSGAPAEPAGSFALPPLIVAQATQLNALAGHNFTQALRAYYYAVPILLWLINPWLLLAGSIAVTTAVYFTEYRSDTARALCVQDLGQPIAAADGRPATSDADAHPQPSRRQPPP